MDDAAERIEGLARMAEQMQKLDHRFGQEPVAGFIKALVHDLHEIAATLNSDQ